METKIIQFKETVELTNKLVIFPKYTVALIRSGYKCHITGKRASDIKLVSYLYEAEIENLGLDDLPEIAIYDAEKKSWLELFAVEMESDVLILDNGKYGQFKYYLRKLDDLEAAFANSLANYVSQFSSASIAFE